jgi:isopenicillin N synthase-like dioxygenase
MWVRTDSPTLAARHGGLVGGEKGLKVCRYALNLINKALSPPARTMQNLATVNVSALFSASASPSDVALCEQQLLAACTSLGFAKIKGAPVSEDVVRNMRQAVAAVFDAPRSNYQSFQVEKTNYRGYVPLGYFTPNDGTTKPDQYEAWKLHFDVPEHSPVGQQSPLYRPNRWPPIAHKVKDAVLAYWASMDRLNGAVLAALCRALKLDADWVLSTLVNPLTNMTLLNYPPSPPKAANWGIHPHKDFNYLTFLAHDPVGGLEVRTPEGGWIDAACEPDEFVMNVGDMLELQSGGRLVSTPHRVINRSGQARQSFPYFSVPRFDVRVEPLLPPVPGFKRAPLMAGEASHAIWYSNWPDEGVKDPAIDLGNYR